MKTLKTEEIAQVSGGNLTSLIMDYFSKAGAGTDSNKEPWEPLTPPGSPALGRGDEIGKAIVTGLAATAAIITAGLFAVVNMGK